ncbi:hypothetical protein VKT23_009108 [Stygiomarasmius scandens]|uniref:C2H2-type domain-containing protein n=1 Tax=Marasmiellus scandens TaxID=2682957 RepID=A0ABR1JGU4_9AGAR
MPYNRSCGTRKPQPSKTCFPHLIGGLGNQNLFSDPSDVDLESLCFFDLVRNESTTDHEVIPSGMTQPYHVPTQIPDVSEQTLLLRSAIDTPQHFIYSETGYANFTPSPWQPPYYTVPTLPSSGELYIPVPPCPYQSFFPPEPSGQAILALFQGGQADHVGVASSSHYSSMYDSTSLYQYPANNPTDLETPQLYINQGMGHDTGFAQGFEPVKSSPIINTSLNDRLVDGGTAHSQVPAVPKLHVATEGVRKNAQKRRKHPGKHICGICGHDFTAAHNLRRMLSSNNILQLY